MYKTMQTSAIKSTLLHIFILLFIINTVPGQSTVIPEERRIEWTPGVPDEIPEINNPVINIMDFGADSTGINDCKSALVDAINSVPPTGGVVYFPAGKYKINSTIDINRDNIVIKGEGDKKTFIYSAANGDCFDIVTYKRGNWQDINSLTKGVRSIVVEDGSKFGQFVEIQQDNDSTLMYTKEDWNVSWAKNAVGQLLEIESIQGNTILLKTSVNIDFKTSLNPRIRPQGLIRNVGFEDFYIEKTVPKGNIFAFKNAAYCRIKNIESYHTRKSHVDFNTALGCEVKNCFFHRSFSYGSGGSGYGVRCGFHSTNILVENNAFDSLRHAMMVSLGANGNVFGYNYSTNNIQGNDENNLNQGWDPPDISLHGHYPFMNLFEGNDVQEIGIGDYWGSAGIGNTFLRNKISGGGIFYYDHSNFQNLIGNITTVLKDIDNNSTQKLEHGNKVNGTVIWNNEISTHDISNSYYYDSKPVFFGNLTWPPFGSEENENNKLPAQLRLQKENNIAEDSIFTFVSTGIGGGGGLFSPSINPNNSSEYYTVCDLGALFHTVNGGKNYDFIHFTQVSGSIYSKVSFTNNDNIRYIIKWDSDNYAARPAKSIDGGNTWDYLSGDSEPWESRYFIYADYYNPQRVVWSTYSNIWITTDGGLHDKMIYSTEQDAGILLSGVYFKGDTIFFGTNEGVLISTDGGQSVKKPGFTGIPSNERIMGFGAGSANGLTRFYALTGGEDDVWCENMGGNYWGAIRGVYTMENMNGIWEKSDIGINMNQDYAVYLSMAINDPNTCYIAGGEIQPYEKPLVMKTEDGGKTWKDVFITDNNKNIFTGYQGYHGDFDYWWGGFAIGFAVNPLNSSQAIITDLGFIHQTIDGAATWHQRYLNSEDENPLNAPTPKKKYYRGIGLQQTSVWQVYWFDEKNIFGCFTDIKGVRSVDGGLSWSFDYNGHDLNTMYHIAKHNNKDMWFAATSAVHDMYETTHIDDNSVSPSWKQGKVLYTTDKGANWQTLKDFGSPVIWVTTDPNNDEVLYASVISPDDKGGIWKATGISNPSTVSWVHLYNPNNANLGRPNNIHVLNDGTLVASWGVRYNNGAFQPGSGIFVSTDGGMTWIDKSHNDMKYWTQDVIIDPFDTSQNTWYVAVWSAWGGHGNDLGRLWRTKDRGTTWEPMTDSRQFHRVYSAAVDPDNPEKMYLTTETEGLWVTENKSDDSPVWKLVEEYPYLAPRRVDFNPFKQNEMWISSFGGGMMYKTKGFTFTNDSLYDIVAECSVEMPESPTGINALGDTIIATTDTEFPITKQGTTIIIWTYTDGNGNIYEQTQKIIINDITPPVPDNINLPDITSNCPVMQVAIPSATDNCKGKINGKSNVAFPINNEGTTQIVWTYDDGNGNITEQEQSIIIKFIDNTITVSGDTLTANATGYKYQWLNCNDGNTPITGENKQTFIVDKSGSYSVIISNDTCSVTSDCVDIIYSSILPLDAKENITIFPNPVKDKFSVRGLNIKNIRKMIIYNQTGRKLLNLNNTKTIDVSDLAPGLYIVEIITRNNIFRKRFIKE